MAQVGNIYFKLTAFSWAGAGTYTRLQGGKITEQVEWLISHHDGNVAPVTRAINKYDCECTIRCQTVITPAAKTTSAASALYTIADETGATAGVTVATCVLGATEIDMDGGPEKSFTQETHFHYTGTSLVPISVA